MMQKETINRACFKCEKEIRAAHCGDDDFTMPPADATYWQTLGNFGSTVFDGGEFTGECLELYICDECLKERAELVYLLKRDLQPKKVTVTNFREHINERKQKTPSGVPRGTHSTISNPPS